jgi:hypothetical protein
LGRKHDAKYILRKAKDLFAPICCAYAPIEEIINGIGECDSKTFEEKIR